MIITESRLKEIIREEVDMHLLTEEMQQEILNEGIVSWLKKTFGSSGGWESLVDDAEDGKIDNKQAFMSLPPKKRIAALALMGLFASSITGYATGEMADISAAEQAHVEKVKDSFKRATERAQQIKGFKDMAQIEASEGGVSIASQQDIDKYLDSVRAGYTFKQAPLAAQTGFFVNGDIDKPVQGFVYVPAEQISDDTVLPFIGMTKKDYEYFLRMNWLLSGGDEKLEKMVKGRSSATTAFWSYQDSLYSPIADTTGASELDSEMIEKYGPNSDKYLILPLEWSVAYDILQKRQAR